MIKEANYFSDFWVTTKDSIETARQSLDPDSVSESVTQVGQMVGYAERRYFTRVFSKQAGMPPSEFRERHQNPAVMADLQA